MKRERFKRWMNILNVSLVIYLILYIIITKNQLPNWFVVILLLGTITDPVLTNSVGCDDE